MYLHECLAQAKKNPLTEGAGDFAASRASPEAKEGSVRLPSGRN
ncbi:hypothetical protein ACFOEY_11320 [Paracandidimonas soli]